MKRTAMLALGLALALGAATLAQDNKEKDTKPAAKTYEGRPLKAWLDDLKDKDPLVQEEAIEVLAAAGKDAKSALPELKRLLKGGNTQVRCRAALAVWSIGGDAKAAVNALSEGLKDASLATRRQALDILARIGPDAAPAVGGVVEQLDDADDTVRTNANRAVSAMGKAAVPGLIKTLDHKEVRIRRNAINLVLSLGTAGVNKEALDTVTARLKDTDLHVRVGAARILFGLRQSEKPVIDALAEGLKSTDVTLRGNVLSAIQSSSERPKTLLPLLEEGIKNKDLGIKVAMARILYEVEKKPARVLAIYTEAIKDNSRAHWSPAVTGLGELGPAAKSAVPRLIELLKVRDYYNYDVRTTLAKIGEPSVKPLVTLLKDTTTTVSTYYGTPQEAAVAILGQIGKPAVKEVLPVLDDKDVNVRSRAVRVMQGIGPDAKDAVTKLVALLKDTNSVVRDAAVQALGAVGTEARSAVPELVKLAKGRDINVRAGSFRAMALIGPDKDDVLETTLDALKENNTTVKQAALELLVRVDPRHKEVVPQLKDQLKIVATRYSALTLAGKLGDDAEKLVPTIFDLLKDPSDYVRRQAVDALAQIGPVAGKDKDNVDTLVEQLKRFDTSLHSSTFTALRNLKVAAKTAVPALTNYVKTSRSYAVSSAIALIGDYGKDASSASDALLALLKDPTRASYDRNAAALALAQVAPATMKKDGLETVRALVRGDATNFQAARVVLMIDPKDKEAIAHLEAGLKNIQYYNRSNAVTQIGLLGKSMKKYLPEVRALLKDQQTYTRGAAALAIYRISGETKEALEVLVAMAKDTSPQGNRSSAAYYLGEMAADAKSALPTLRVLLNDREAWTRTQAQASITRIERAVADAKKALKKDDDDKKDDDKKD